MGDDAFEWGTDIWLISIKVCLFNFEIDDMFYYKSRTEVGELVLWFPLIMPETLKYFSAKIRNKNWFIDSPIKSITQFKWSLCIWWKLPNNSESNNPLTIYSSQHFHSCIIRRLGLSYFTEFSNKNYEIYECSEHYETDDSQKLRENNK